MAPLGYQLQHVDTPEGDCGMSATIIVRDRDSATQYSEALRADGIHSGTAYNEGFPDWHIYTPTGIQSGIKIHIIRLTDP